MKAPPFLVAAALLFWAIETKLYLYGISAALILESSRIIQRRWDLTAKDFSRIVDFCSVAFLVGAIFSYGQLRQNLLDYIRWTPLIFLPFMVAEAYSSRDLVSMSTFFWLLRKKGQPQNAMPGRGLSFAFPYVGICIVSSSTTVQHDYSFFIGTTIILAWSFWWVRKARTSPFVWATSFALAVALGFVGQAWLHYFQYVLEMKSAEWFSEWRFPDLDKAMSRTTIGSIGKMKLSNAVLMKLKVPKNQQPPLYLCDATYQIYRQRGRDASWYSSRPDYKPILSENDGKTWKLIVQKPEEPPRFNIQYLVPFSSGRGTLALPSNTSVLSDLEAILVEKNEYGTVRIDGAPAFLSYTAGYGGDNTLDSQPTPEDMKVPSELIPTLKQVIEVNHILLKTQSDRDKMAALHDYFQKNFSYTLDIKHNMGSIFHPINPLTDFMLNTHKGHCQYFATATTLMLRQLGIPARYATGFAVQEYSNLTELYVIRSRHAHAWVRAYVDQRWIDFDTTPASWAKDEEDNISIWRKSMDFFSWIWFNFSQWRSLSLKEDFRLVFMGISTLIGGGLAIYFVFKKRKDLKFVEKSRKSKKSTSHRDSEFYKLEEKITALGHPRYSHETIQQWILRLRNETTLEHLDRISELSKLHYQYRFDPKGLKPEERQKLKVESEELTRLFNHTEFTEKD